MKQIGQAAAAVATGQHDSLNSAWYHYASLAQEVAEESISEATRKAYKGSILEFLEFCKATGVYNPVGANGLTVAGFLVKKRQHYLSMGCGPGQVIKARAALSHFFAVCGVTSSPTDTLPVKKVIESCQRSLKFTVTVLRDPLSMDDVIKVVAAGAYSVDSTLRTLTFATACAIGFAGYLRCRDLLNICVHEDLLTFAADGSRVEIFLGKSKTDQRWEGAVISLPALPGCIACPVSLLRRLVSVGGYVTHDHTRDCGPLFRTMRLVHGQWRLQQITSDLSSPIPPMSDDVLRRGVKDVCSLAGVDSDINVHSMRIGRAAHDAIRGVPKVLSMQQGRWKSADVHSRYVRAADAILLQAMQG